MRGNRWVVLWSWMIIAAASSVSGEEWLRIGEPLRGTEAIPIQRILDDPGPFHDQEVRIEGRIASVCTEEGCFVEIVADQGNGEGIVVNFPGLSHTFPLDCAGLEAKIEGRFYQKVFPHARVDHWQQHTFRPGVHVPEYSLAFRMDGIGAEIGGTRATPPGPAEIRTASPDQIDLASMGFEAEGFGVDRRRIAPGETVPRPSTGGNRWMVICRTGEVSVHREDRPKPTILGAGQLGFLPAGVLFEVHNAGSESASFDLVYSRQIEKEKPHRH